MSLLLRCVQLLAGVVGGLVLAVFVVYPALYGGGNVDCPAGLLSENDCTKQAAFLPVLLPCVLSGIALALFVGHRLRKSLDE